MNQTDLTVQEFEFGLSLLSGACHSRPETLQPWTLRGQTDPLGWMEHDRALRLSRRMPAHVPLVLEQQGWVWHADDVAADERSRVLQEWAMDLRDLGEITGWRDELYACWGCLEDPWPYDRPELFRLERAAFRHLGLRSHATHVNGLTPDGRMWCGRRAMSKATDPGQLDNLAAGGLAAGEDPLHSAVREVWEEAGLVLQPNDLLPALRYVVTERQVPEGWHSERLFVWNLSMQSTDVPQNRDGEVSEFLCLTRAEVIQRIKAGEFTPDAACAIAAAWMSCGEKLGRQTGD